MTAHGRKRGDKLSYPICVWSGIFDHYDKIGPAIWEFLWLVDAITLEENGIGWVYGKSPFKIERIVNDLRGSTRRTVERNLARLKNGGYITTQKARYGIVVGVVNSRKIRPRMNLPDTPKVASLAPSHAKNGGTNTPKMADLAAKNGGTGDSILMDNAVRQSSRTGEPTAAADSPTIWKLLGSDLPMGSLGFQKLFEHYAATRNGNPMSEAMERTIQASSKRGVKVPPPFYEAKRRVERREAGEFAAPTGNEIPELEAEPWAK